MSNIYEFKKEYLNECAELFVKTFSQEPWNEPWNFESAKKRLNDVVLTPGFRGAVLRNDEKIEGVILGNLEQWYDGEHFCVKEFFVDSSSQGKGTGKKLLNALENILMKKEVGVVHFWTMKGSTAEAFYNKRGYEIPKELIMMRKKLK
ncbi:GNAT family N-acetyltransferase [Clostridium perfringens]|uniref:GNAT family N-acetyltransferase n=1 Tax=Clostridium perfringens TaxID=1502 RepID=UPI0013E29AF2|nr:GNAT family N-acetyltransferase [Clostridium perfringens]EJT6171093.1 GNAT family N-acetyltransferase [Clostridium perfringens]EJT6541819.1 GNAT family N-acetyltransferase [Clostridium perfringens]EJT6566826.1 GNAT family N-acetyltransferase [Clostridium perfringens]MBO3387867.1 GNAT family N-acetyltransferase [Clostridium perfringens]MBO3413324.1 GNAT family N-acetyltransferase [Clostridium perfringens]